MYGFPESHAASFALLAYASAYLRTHYLPAFTCALLNNQPMGFYHPATIVKDAQRHGLRVRPVDINRSKAVCILEQLELRLGFNYVRSLRASTAALLEARQPYTSINDVSLRVPELNKDEMQQLAAIGAFNSIGAEHRRNALWQAAWASRPAGELLKPVAEMHPETPLHAMTLEERLIADRTGIGMTLGPHPMAYRREEMNRLRVTPAAGLPEIRNGRTVRVAGNVIVRQRPGTAKGVLFMSLEDETGISNVVVLPEVFELQRREILTHAWVLVEGKMQNVDSVIHIQAERVVGLGDPLHVGVGSHDFH
jgi:error-prone DNA polymerase